MYLLFIVFASYLVSRPDIWPHSDKGLRQHSTHQTSSKIVPQYSTINFQVVAELHIAACVPEDKPYTILHSLTLTLRRLTDIDLKNGGNGRDFSTIFWLAYI